MGRCSLLCGSYLGLGFTVALIAGISVILGAVYLLRVVQRWLYGKRHPSLDRLPDLSASEVLAVVPLLLLSFVFGFYPKPINDQAVPVVIQLAKEAAAVKATAEKAAAAKVAAAKTSADQPVAPKSTAIPATAPAVVPSVSP